jgi:diacylglycerol kinase family enzyme
MIRSRWKHHSETLKRLVEQTGAKARLPGAGPSPIAPPQGLILTTGPGQAEQAVSRLIAEWGALGGDTFHLIITAGGDGTSREALSAVYKAAESVRQRLGVLRLPLGTGNDGADAPALDKALEALLYPCEAALSRAVRLTTARGAEFYGFNILSLGLDAFVTHMTNKMKGFFPGDSYKLWVDMAALFYDTLYHVGEMQVEGFDEQGNRTGFLKEPLLLLAMGPSGRRSYGSGKRILPDERNVCALKQMPLFRKLALKGLFASGGHAGKAEAVLFHAHKLIIQGAAPILAQMDGETALLGPEDFPASLARTEPVIPTLQPRPLRGFL